MLRHRKIEPGVAMLGPYRLFGHRKVAIGKSPRRDADQVREPFGVPPQRRSAVGAEMEGHVAAARRRALERLGPGGQFDAVAGEKAATLKSDQVRLWQSKQWQSDTLAGSPVTG